MASIEFQKGLEVLFVDVLAFEIPQSLSPETLEMLKFMFPKP